jgi:hypothetical protein
MHNFHRSAFGIAALVVVTSFATAAYAGGPSSAEKRAACRSDVMRYCFGSISSDDKVEACLRGHRAQLSTTCNALFDKYEAVPGQGATSASPQATTEPAAIESPAKVANEKRGPSVAAPQTPAQTTAPVSEGARANVPPADEMTMGVRPCDIINCADAPAAMEKVMRDMAPAMAKVMRDMAPSMAKGMPNMPRF